MFLNEENHKTSNYQLLDDIPVLILVDNFVDWINPIIALKRNFEYEQIKILIIGFERIGIL